MGLRLHSKSVAFGFFFLLCFFFFFVFVCSFVRLFVCSFVCFSRLARADVGMEWERECVLLSLPLRVVLLLALHPRFSSLNLFVRIYIHLPERKKIDNSRNGICICIYICVCVYVCAWDSMFPMRVEYLAGHKGNQKRRQN